MTGQRGSPLGGRHLLHTNSDGSRTINWRVWVLIWVTPVTFLGAVLFLSLQTLWFQQEYFQTTGTVTHVYAWDNNAPQIFYPGDKIYSPRFRYTWSDGSETEATIGTSHTTWNFEIGSVHPIRFDPGMKDDVILIGPSEWWLPQTIAAIGTATVPFALLGTFLVLRWRARGEPVT